MPFHISLTGRWQSQNNPNRPRWKSFVQRLPHAPTTYASPSTLTTARARLKLPTTSVLPHHLPRTTLQRPASYAFMVTKRTRRRWGPDDDPGEVLWGSLRAPPSPPTTALSIRIHSGRAWVGYLAQKKRVPVAIGLKFILFFDAVFRYSRIGNIISKCVWPLTISAFGNLMTNTTKKNPFRRRNEQNLGGSDNYRLATNNRDIGLSSHLLKTQSAITDTARRTGSDGHTSR